MTVNYQLTAEELIAFSCDFKRFSPAWLPRLYWCGVLPILLVALALATSIGVASIFTVLFALSSLGISQWQSRIYYRVLFSPDHVSVQTLPITATLLEEGIRFENAAGHTTYSWHFIRNVSRQGRYVRFTITPIQRHHIPVAAFRDDVQLAEFLSFATSHANTRNSEQ